LYVLPIKSIINGHRYDLGVHSWTSNIFETYFSHKIGTPLNLCPKLNNYFDTTIIKVKNTKIIVFN